MQLATARRYLTIQQTAEMLAVSPLTIRRRIADGDLDAVRVGSGRSLRIPADAVDQMLRPVAAAQ